MSKEHTLLQQVSSLEELAAQTQEKQSGLLAFSLKPLSEKDVMATKSLLQQKVTIFIPLVKTKDLLSKLELRLDSRQDKKKYCNSAKKLTMFLNRLFLYEKKPEGHVTLHEAYAIKGNCD